jgi:hypothetical protein
VVVFAGSGQLLKPRTTPSFVKTCVQPVRIHSAPCGQ